MNLPTVTVPQFNKALSVLSNQVKVGAATDASFATVATLRMAVRFPSRRASREAGANLGCLRLLKAIAA